MIFIHDNPYYIQIVIIYFFSLNESVCCRIRFIANKYASLLTKYDADDTSNNISDVYLEVIYLLYTYSTIKLNL